MSMSLSAIRSEFRSGSYYRDSQLVQVQRVSEYRMLSPKWTSLTPPSSQGTGSIKTEVVQSSPEPEIRANQCLLDMTEPLPHECTQLWLPTQELHRASPSALQCRWERKVQEVPHHQRRHWLLGITVGGEALLGCPCSNGCSTPMHIWAALTGHRGLLKKPTTKYIKLEGDV